MNNIGGIIVKRVAAFILMITVAFSVSLSGAEGKRYTDVESGVSFDIPTGWEEVPNVDNNQSIKIQYTPSDSVGLVTVALAVLDLYSATGLSQLGVARKDIDFSYLDDDLMTQLLGPMEVKSQEVKKYGNYQYRVITTTLERTKAGLTFSFDCEMVVSLVNGYVILFQYMEMNHSEVYHAVFEYILDSVQIK